MGSNSGTQYLNTLRARRMGVDTEQENVVFMRKECHVCRAEGLSARARVRLTHGSRSIIATLYHITSDILSTGAAGLSESAWERLGVAAGGEIAVSHPQPLESLSKVRSKVYGNTLDGEALHEIIADVVAGHYSDIHLSSFLTACSARGLNLDEMIALTRAMIDTGETITWGNGPIGDKHSVGGLPGNRTSPIVVAIAAACGLVIPKTSSRFITSPAGTADTMETMAPVDLDIATIRRVVEREGGCIAWGGAVRLSPADDILIRVERPLDLDTEGQLVASLISKKVAAGSTHLVLDMPVGPTAKVRTPASAQSLAAALLAVAEAFGLKAKILFTDGTQPVGRGIGPALEARDVLSVLRGEPAAPVDLRSRALQLSAALLELSGTARAGDGMGLAESTLRDGHAWRKFQRICEAQGGMRVPPTSSHRRVIAANNGGRVIAIDNRRIAKIAKLAGAPVDKAAGVELHAHVGNTLRKGDPLFTIHAESPGELDYANDYVCAQTSVFTVQ